MKRSEMFLALYNEFGHKLNSIVLVDEILTFLEKQGMRPPPYTPKNSEGDRVQFLISYNEWENEE
jgi:hypothetical protein